MMTIPLTQGQVALVDDADYSALSAYKWHAWWSKKTQSFYAVRNTRKPNGEKTTESMHRRILELTDRHVQGDHRDHNTLNNQRANLRPVTKSQNMMNRSGAASHNKSGFRGVSWHREDRRWRARIKVNGKTMFLGNFTTPEAAFEAYGEANKKYFGEYGGVIA
jgi:hypothetical protein